MSRTNLLEQLRAARRDLIARMEGEVDPDQTLPAAGFLALLADLQGAIAAVEALDEEEGSEP